MNETKIRVLKVEPMKHPEEVTLNNTLRVLQAAVGGINLEENYDQGRNIYEDDGGFAIIVEDEKELQEANAYVNLETDIYEYLEEVNENYIGMLKLCNNEFSTMIYIRKVLCSDESLDCLYGNDESGRE